MFTHKFVTTLYPLKSGDPFLEDEVSCLSISFLLINFSIMVLAHRYGSSYNVGFLFLEFLVD